MTLSKLLAATKTAMLILTTGSNQGCSDDIAPFPFTEAGTSSPSSNTDTSSTVPTTTVDTSDTSTGESACEQNYPLPVIDFILEDERPQPERVFVERSCGGLGVVGDDPDDRTKLDPDLDNFDVYVYHPAIPNAEGWPDFKLPYVVFSPGAGHNAVEMSNGASLYLPIVASLTGIGFAVFVIQPPANFRGENWTVAQRAGAMGCTALWAFRGWSEEANHRLNCDFVVAGHSRGGESAYLLASLTQSFLAGIDRLVLRAVVAIAPRSNTSNLHEIATGPVSGEFAVPYLSLHGGNDEDVQNGPTRAFELYGSEDSIPLPINDKILVWAYDVPHNTWGGKVTLPAYLTEEIAKAEVLERIYIPPFLRWQFLNPGDSTDKQFFTELVRNGSSAADLPSQLDHSDFWEDSAPEYQDLDERPLVFANFTPGLKGDPDSRVLVDTMLRPGFEEACTPLSPSTLGEAVSISGLDSSQVCLGTTLELVQTPEMFESEHLSTSAMRVRWGGSELGGSVRWIVDRDMTRYSHLSFRLGQIFGKSPDTSTAIRIGLETPLGGQLFSVDVPVISQSNEDVDETFSMTGRIVDFMRTVRIPLSEFCELGADIEQVDAIVLSFSDDVDSRSVLVDSIEFSRPTDDNEPGICL